MSFKDKVRANSVLNLETSGVIMGRIVEDEVVLICNIVVPEQIISSNHTEVTPSGEESLSSFMISNNCHAVGFIHTHPQYDTLPSSVDLHNLFTYQKLSKHYISVIQSVRDKTEDIWQLSEEGMEEIGMCNKKSFHDDHNDEVTGRIKENLFLKAQHVTQSSRYSGKVKILGVQLVKNKKQDGQIEYKKTKVNMDPQHEFLEISPPSMRCNTGLQSIRTNTELLLRIPHIAYQYGRSEGNLGDDPLENNHTTEDVHSESQPRELGDVSLNK